MHTHDASLLLSCEWVYYCCAHKALTNTTMPNPTKPNDTETKKTIKALRKATTAYIYAIRKAKKSMWFPDIAEKDKDDNLVTVAQFMVNCMNAIDEANKKFIA